MSPSEKVENLAELSTSHVLSSTISCPSGAYRWTTGMFSILASEQRTREAPASISKYSAISSLVFCATFSYSGFMAKHARHHGAYHFTAATLPRDCAYCSAASNSSIVWTGETAGDDDANAAFGSGVLPAASSANNSSFSVIHGGAKRGSRP